MLHLACSRLRKPWGSSLKFGSPRVPHTRQGGARVDTSVSQTGDEVAARHAGATPVPDIICVIPQIATCGYHWVIMGL